MSQAPEVTSTGGPPMEEVLAETCRARRARKPAGVGGVEKVQRPGWEAEAAVGRAQRAGTADPSAATALRQN